VFEPLCGTFYNKWQSGSDEGSSGSVCRKLDIAQYFLLLLLLLLLLLILLILLLILLRLLRHAASPMLHSHTVQHAFFSAKHRLKARATACSAMPGKKKAAKSKAARQADRQRKVTLNPFSAHTLSSPLFARPNSCSAPPSPLASSVTWTTRRRPVSAPHSTTASLKASRVSLLQTSTCLHHLIAPASHPIPSAICSQIPIAAPPIPPDRPRSAPLPPRARVRRKKP
jgi:hypothetical protein